MMMSFPPHDSKRLAISSGLQCESWNTCSLGTTKVNTLSRVVVEQQKPLPSLPYQNQLDLGLHLHHIPVVGRARYSRARKYRAALASSNSGTTIWK